jgi:hypothetical protein
MFDGFESFLQEHSSCKVPLALERDVRNVGIVGYLFLFILCEEKNK